MSRRMGGRRRHRMSRRMGGNPYQPNSSPYSFAYGGRRSRRMMGGLFPTNQIMPYLPVQYHGSLGGRRRSRRMMAGGSP